MADCFWTGATNTTYTTATNWRDGAAPSAGDNVYFTLPATNAPAGSDQSATALASVVIGPGYDRSTFASSGSFLILDTNKFSYDNETCTEAWISLQNGAAAASIEVNILNSYDGSATPTVKGLHLKCNSTDVFSPCRVHGSTDATVTFDSDCNITTIEMTGGLVYVLDADGITTVTIIGGELHYDVATALTTLNVGGSGVFYIDDGDTAAITTINIYGGTVYANGTGTITTLNIYGGSFDASVATARFTITNTSVYDGDLDVSNGIGEPTFTNAPKILGSGSITYSKAASSTVGTLIR